MAEIDTQAQTATQPLATPRQGERCESCGSPLASDQRYCLNCGHRRGGPRVDYRHYMVAGAGGEPPQAPSQQSGAASEPEEPVKKERDYAPLAAVGGIAVLGLMLLVGVLIGKGNSNDTAATPTKVVVPAVSGPNTASSEGGESEAPAKKAKGAGGSSTGAKKANGSLTSGKSGGDTVEASDSELESLESESGASYEEKSKKLPNKIATPGKPPPIDKTTPPGGGEGGGEVIK